MKIPRKILLSQVWISEKVIEDWDSSDYGFVRKDWSTKSFIFAPRPFHLWYRFTFWIIEGWCIFLFFIERGGFFYREEAQDIIKAASTWSRWCWPWRHPRYFLWKRISTRESNPRWGRHRPAEES